MVYGRVDAFSNLLGISPVLGNLQLSNGINMSLSTNPTGTGNTDMSVTNDVNSVSTHTFYFAPGEIENNVVTMVNVNTELSSGYPDNCNFAQNPIGPGITLTPQQWLLLCRVNKNLYDNLLLQYTTLLDNGNTNLLIDQIEYTAYNNMIPLFNSLMATSPYLSEATLLAAIERAAFPNNLLAIVLAANPQFAKDTAILTALQTRGFTGYEMAAIYAGQNTFSLLELLRLNMQAIKLEGYQNLRNATMAYQADSTLVNSNDSIAAIYANMWEPQDVHLRMTFTDTPSNLLNEWPDHYSLNSDEENERQDLLHLHRIMPALLTTDSLDNATTSDLEAIMNTSGARASLMAENLLNYFGRELEEENLSIPENMGTLRSARQSLVGQSSASQNKYTLFPNPANNLLTIKAINGVQGATHVELYDALGRIVMSALWPMGAGNILLEIGDLPSGMYAAKIWMHDITLQQLPMIKQ